MTRKTFSERMVLTVLLKQGAEILCPRCEKPIMLGHKIDREHFHELALGGADDVENCFYSHAECHAIATNGTKATSAGSSKHRIAKSKRMIKARTEPAEPTAWAKKYAWQKGLKERQKP
jgi:hypothetical protein